MSEVWAVTEGEYSDYHVMCICPTEEMANAVAEKLGGDEHGYEVGAFPFFDAMPELIYRLSITGTSGENHDPPHEDMRGYLIDEVDRTPCRHDRWVNWSDPPYVQVSVSGVDHERVRKTFSEQMAQAKADAPILIAKRKAQIAEQEAKYGPLRPGDFTTSIDAGIRKSP